MADRESKREMSHRLVAVLLVLCPAVHSTFETCNVVGGYEQRLSQLLASSKFSLARFKTKAATPHIRKLQD